MPNVLTEPKRSLIRQRFDSNQRSEPLNGGGFGVGSYSPRLHLMHIELYPSISRHFQDKQNESEEEMIVSSEPLNKDSRRDVTPNTMLVLDRRKAPL